MPASQNYDPSNVFAKILRGEMSCHRVYEDDVALAFMDIMPRIEGHVLVIPKVAVRTIFDIAPEDLAQLMPRVQKVAKATRRAMAAEGLLIQQFNEPAAGQVVFHLHFHVLPRWTGIALRPPGGPMEKPEVLQSQAEKIRAAIED
jgi:histidine triad (HIT) family protein